MIHAAQHGQRTRPACWQARPGIADSSLDLNAGHQSKAQRKFVSTPTQKVLAEPALARETRALPRRLRNALDDCDAPIRDKNITG